MKQTIIAAAAALLAMIPAAASDAADRLIDQRESIYNSIFIYERGAYVSLLFGKNRRLYQESRANREDPLELPVLYTRFMTLGLAYAATPERVLEIGVGGGTTVAYLARSFPEISIDAVELDPAVIDFAKQYFFLKESDRLRVHIRDGRVFLMRNREAYDLILVDAYRGPFVPFQLTTREFYALAKRNLREGGALVQNVDPSTLLYDSTVATLAAVFAKVDVYEARGNYVLIAHDGAASVAQIAARAAALDAAYAPRYPLAELFETRRAAAPDPAIAPLTDDFAPVEALKAIDRGNHPQ